MPAYILRRLPPTVNHPGGGAAVMLGDRPVYCLPATIDDPLPRVLARCQQTADALNHAMAAADLSAPALAPLAWTPGWNDAPAPTPQPADPIRAKIDSAVAARLDAQPDPIRALLVAEAQAARSPQEPRTDATRPTPAPVAPKAAKAPTASPARRYAPTTAAPLLDF